MYNAVEMSRKNLQMLIYTEDSKTLEKLNWSGNISGDR